MKLEVLGDKSFLDLSGPIIFSANHTGEFDPIVFPLILPINSKHYPLYFVSNPQDRYRSFGWRSVFYGGIFFNFFGAYQIFSGKHDYQYSLQNHIKILNQGKNICIFPEGKRTLDGNFSRAHGGLGFLAFNCRAVIVPISIKTFYKVSLMDFFSRKKTLKIFVGKPIFVKELFNTENPTVSDFQNASQKVLDIIEENYRKI